METMRQFLYDEFHRDIPQEERPPYNEWRREWNYSDRSQSAPRQMNNDDCGIFTLVGVILPFVERHRAHTLDIQPKFNLQEESMIEH